MPYFWINLGFTLLIILLCIVGTIICIKDIRENKTKALWIIVITLIPLILLLAVQDALPYFKDIKYVMNKQFLVSNYTVEKVGLSSKLGNDFSANGKSFYGSNSFKLKKGEKYTLTYTPNRRFVIKAAPIK
ncbi:MAG: hypothetical protein ABF633_10385 [Clostridium sp.]|uniref:hypothetical protein n=1 Tax=Clostridium sp. TaxID=1506 RepID=UPI0039EB7FAC